MRLTEFLSPDAVKVPLDGESKSAILRELIELACRGLGREAVERVFASVMEREELMSTGIGQGIALPHGTSPQQLEFAAAFGIPVEPVDFNAIDGEPVTLVFLLLSDEEHTNTKMRALARISRLLHRESFRHQLAACTTAREAMQVIRDEEARHCI